MEEQEEGVSMVDVLKEEELMEEDANAVLGGSDDKNCTYDMVRPKQCPYTTTDHCKHVMKSVVFVPERVFYIGLLNSSDSTFLNFDDAGEGIAQFNEILMILNRFK